jgi:hypothetical protein
MEITIKVVKFFLRSMKVEGDNWGERMTREEKGGVSMIKVHNILM